MNLKIFREIPFKKFEPWDGAVDIHDLLKKIGKLDKLEKVLEENYPNGITETDLNDLLNHEPEEVFEWIGLNYDVEYRKNKGKSI